MKITDVKVFLLKPTVLVRVETDAGVTGWGECSPMNGEVVAAHVRHSLSEWVVGEDPFDVERLVERMLVGTYKIAGQTQAMAASGIEIACWDIMGKALGVLLAVLRCFGRLSRCGREESEYLVAQVLLHEGIDRAVRVKHSVAY